MSLVDRLSKQLILHDSREEDLRTRNICAENAVAELKLIEEQINAVKEQKEKAEAALLEAEKEAEENNCDARELAALNEKERKDLMRELEDHVTAVNDRVEKETKRQSILMHENARLLEQVGILESHQTQGDNKFTEFIATREKEASGLEGQRNREQELGDILRQKIDLQQQQIDEASLTRDKLKEVVDGYLKRFSDVQEQLQKARSTFEIAQTEKDRLHRKLVSAQADRQRTRQRADRARKDLEAEKEVENKLEKQISAVDSQKDKLDKMTEFFESKE
eukprot:Tbor_TRINITY_DN656_c0_g1::TRINITY_DN656_c0_g1_i1::g.1612::m.1612